MLAKIVNREEATNSSVALSLIKESMQATSKISSFTHNFYKYPACFPETFPRSVIRSFSREGDLILDPFVGGGTSAVESLASRRNFIGFDINDLAIFSSTFKTLILDKKDVLEIDSFISDFEWRAGRRREIAKNNPFLDNVPFHISIFVEAAKSRINRIERPRAQKFCIGVLLRTIQLEIDREIKIKNSTLETRFLNLLDDCLDKSLQFQASTLHSLPRSKHPTTRMLKANMADPRALTKHSRNIGREVDLVVTSPPYPQKHILYNKWQVRGRSETRLPYWIIDSSDHYSEKHYTMGGRDSKASLDIYMNSIFAAFSNVNQLVKKGGLVVQVVAFNDMKSQFMRYLDEMKRAGFEEIRNIDRSSYDGRLWRHVPNQRWYNRSKGIAAACQEVVLFHKKAKSV